MPCIGPLHRPRGGPKPDFDFAHLSYPPTPLPEVEFTDCHLGKMFLLFAIQIRCHLIVIVVEAVHVVVAVVVAVQDLAINCNF